jgi:glycosyltransferase involved in cell wall biosynthesis
MAVLVARSAARIFVSVPIWERVLRRLTRMNAPIAWLPVPSGIPVVDDPSAVGAAKRRYAEDGSPLLGHFGTYGAYVARPLNDLLPHALSDQLGLRVLLIGANSWKFRAAFIREHPELAARIQATGTLPVKELSHAVSACDLMVQPYSDGASTRRTCLMAALAHGRAVITSSGIATEPLWAESGAVALAPAGNFDAMRSLIMRLLADEAQRVCYSAKATELYARRFDLRHTIEALRSA